MSPEIVVRADASRSVGLGHVARCLALARALRRRGAEVTFLCRSLPGDAGERILREGFALQRLELASHSESEDAAACLAWLQRRPGVRWLIVDHYELGADWERFLRPHVGELLAIDDLPARRHCCDLLLDPNLSAQPPGRDERGAGAWLAGPRYALLDAAFAAVGEARGAQVAQARKVLLSFGGADGGGDTEKALRALAAVDWRGQVEVVIGPANERRRQIETLAARLPAARCLYDITAAEMAAAMGRAELAVGAGGGSALERCAAALPGLAIAQADNQRTPARLLAEHGAQLYLGESSTVDEEQIARAVLLLAENANLRHSMARRGRELVDGLGAERLARRLCRPQVLLRPARHDDCEAVWHWRNAPEVRRYSGDGKAIAWSVHRAWFEAVLADASRHLFIGESEGRPVGVLRFDLAHDEAEVSIYLCPDRHGQGYAAALLAQGHRWLREHCPGLRRVIAEVRSDNAASLALFRGQGYRPWKQQWVYSMETELS